MRNRFPKDDRRILYMQHFCHFEVQEDFNERAILKIFIKAGWIMDFMSDVFKELIGKREGSTLVTIATNAFKKGTLSNHLDW